MTRQVDFVRFTTPNELATVAEVFERGGFYDPTPEQCLFRNGLFLLWDRNKCNYVVIVCRNNNGYGPYWQ